MQQLLRRKAYLRCLVIMMIMILILENSGILAAAASSGEVTVYWVSNGIVFHLDKNCASLSRSKNILEGTIAESRNQEGAKSAVISHKMMA